MKRIGIGHPTFDRPYYNFISFHCIAHDTNVAILFKRTNYFSELFLFLNKVSIFDAMTAREQKKLMDSALVKVKEDGRTIGWFLKTAGISRSHWHFMRVGERPLLPSSIQKINNVLNKIENAKA